ncbi:MAG TPA: hypothetical protein VFB67_11525 [Candidatus Polarisedimenticolaceae bacterium]|nr:hypothetical protein [Candidatus Polarisedimenticolaceae bacterium]
MSGFPYLSEDDEQGRARIIPLPEHGSRHELQLLAFDRVRERRRPLTLVFGPGDALDFDENGGSLRAATAQ